MYIYNFAETEVLILDLFCVPKQFSNSMCIFIREGEKRKVKNRTKHMCFWKKFKNIYNFVTPRCYVIRKKLRRVL